MIWNITSAALILLLIYLVAGYVYNVAWNGLRGVEAIPHWWLWCELGAFFSELGSNLRARLFGPSPTAGGYQQI